MNAIKRPLPVTVICWIYLGAGVVGLSYHATEFKLDGSWQWDVILVCFVRLLAIVGGYFGLRGKNWARWLMVLWMAYHVGLSGFHSPGEMMMHALFLALIGFFLFRRDASNYFSSRVVEAKI